MKKILSLILVAALVLALAACGGTTTDENNNQTSEKVETQPITPTPEALTIGSVTLNAEHIPFDAPYMTGSSKNPSVDVLGNTVYVADGDEKIKIYSFDGNALSLTKEADIETGDSIAVDGNGNLYADGGVFEAKIYDSEGNEIGKAPATGDISVSKTSDFALSYFPGHESVTKISGGAAEPWVITNIGKDNGAGKFYSVSAVKIQGSHVLVGGEDSEKGLVAAYDFDGNQIFVSKDDTDGNLPEILAETANGYMSTSSGILNLFSADGTLIGAEDTDDLFGVENAWIYGLIPMEDGSVLALITNRASSADNQEILLFKLTGF